MWDHYAVGCIFMKKKKELLWNQEAFILRALLPLAFAALITKKDKKASNFRWLWLYCVWTTRLNYPTKSVIKHYTGNRIVSPFFMEWQSDSKPHTYTLLFLPLFYYTRSSGFVAEQINQEKKWNAASLILSRGKTGCYKGVVVDCNFFIVTQKQPFSQGSNWNIAKGV